MIATIFLGECTLALVKLNDSAFQVQLLDVKGKVRDIWEYKDRDTAVEQFAIRILRVS